jgi:hypothetical protein
VLTGSVAGQVRLADYLTSVVDGEGEVVHHASKAAQVSHRIPLPEQGVNDICGGRTLLPRANWKCSLKSLQATRIKLLRRIFPLLKRL